MNETQPRVWLTHSGEETHSLGAHWAQVLLEVSRQPEALCQVVWLSGDLGAGKSTFARGVLMALGARGPIKSPSYMLLESYELPGLHAVHLDLYRLQDPEELENLGLADYHRPRHLWLVEWPEKAAGRLPPPDLHLRFSIEACGHRIERIEFLAANK